MTSIAKKQYAHLSGVERNHRTIILRKAWYHLYSTLSSSPQKSTISREIHRNGGVRRYDSTTADTKARTQWKQSHAKERIPNEFIREYIASHLPQYWSPELIAGRRKKDYGRCISHETIYSYIYKTSLRVCPLFTKLPFFIKRKNSRSTEKNTLYPLS